MAAVAFQMRAAVEVAAQSRATAGGGHFVQGLQGPDASPAAVVGVFDAQQRGGRGKGCGGTGVRRTQRILDLVRREDAPVPARRCAVTPERAAGPPPSERTTCDAPSMRTRSPDSVWERIATWLVIEPVGM